MTEDEGVGELLLQANQEVEQGVSLCLGSGVSWLSVLIQTSLVTDANGMGVVEVAVGTGFFQFSAFVQAPVSFNVIMIANVFEMTVLDMVFFAGFKDNFLPSGVPEQCKIMRVMVLIKRYNKS